MTPAVHCRPTQAGDLPHLPAIERAAGQLFLTLDELAWLAEDAEVWEEDAHRRFMEQGTSWVAVAEHRPVGFVIGERFDDALHLWELSVAPDWQGRGIGRALMTRVAEHAAAAGLAGLTLTTFVDVPWNGPFYETLGFRRLHGEALNLRLRTVLSHEGDAGLPMDRRCAMGLAFRSSGEGR